MVKQHVTDRDIARYAADLLQGSKAEQVRISIETEERSRKTYQCFDQALNQAGVEDTPNREAMIEDLLAARTKTARTTDNVLRPAFGRPGRRNLLAAAGALAAAVLLFFMVLPVLRSPQVGMEVAQITGKAYDDKGNELQQGKRLPAGTTFRTGSKSSLELRFAAGRFQLQANSRLAFESARLRKSDGKPDMACRLQDGTLISDLDSNRLARLRIRLPGADVEVLGTRFVVAVHSNRSSLYVERGRVRVIRARSGQRHTAGARELISVTAEKISKRRLPAPAAGDRPLNPDQLSTIVNTNLTTPAPKEKDGSEKIKKSGAQKSASQKKNRHKDQRANRNFRERLILTDGNVISGRIIRQTTTAVTIRSHLGVMTIPRTRIKRVVYTR